MRGLIINEQVNGLSGNGGNWHIPVILHQMTTRKYHGYVIVCGKIEFRAAEGCEYDCVAFCGAISTLKETRQQKNVVGKILPATILPLSKFQWHFTVSLQLMFIY